MLKNFRAKATKRFTNRYEAKASHRLLQLAWHKPTRAHSKRVGPLKQSHDPCEEILKVFLGIQARNVKSFQQMVGPQPKGLGRRVV